MALPISVTYTFATATSAIPLSQLDANFTTVVNGINGIGNGTNALSNVSITGGTIDGTTIGATTSSTGRFSTVTATTGNITTVNATTLNAATHRSDTSLTFQTNGTTTAMTVDASQNVGIGTNSPALKLTVSSGSSTTNTTGQIRATADVAAFDLVAFGSTAASYGMWGASEAGAFSTYPINIMTTGASASIKFATGGNTERMRIDSSGNVGIGTSTPNANTGTSLVLYSTNTPRFRLTNSTTGQTASDGSEISLFSTGELVIENRESEATIFYNGGSERSRINSTGSFLVGSTNNGVGIGDLTTVNGSQLSPAGFVGATRTDEAAAYFTRNNSDGRIANFYRNATGVGGISVTTTGTSFNTSSDYRLKYDVQPMTTGLATVVALNPVTYKWNSNDTYGEGFIAHELQEVVPAAVDGDKDAVDANGNIVAQSVDYSKIVVHLVAACQELKAQNDELKARVAALETK